MNETRRIVVITALVKALRERGSWCGETHVQKNSYFLQELLDVPLGYEFILYKHGPFSFDLRDELSGMRADGLLDIEPRPYPYGPSLEPTEVAESISVRFPETLSNHEVAIEFVTSHFGNKGVVDLERMATALFVTRELPAADPQHRAARLVELKPHVPLVAAQRAVEQVDEIASEAAALAT